MIHLWVLITMSAVAVASHTRIVQVAAAFALKIRVAVVLASVLLIAQNYLIGMSHLSRHMQKNVQ